MCRSNSLPVIHAGGCSYVFQTSPKQDTISSSAHAPFSICWNTRTVAHRHAQIVHGLPTGECLPQRTAAPIARRVVIVLQEVPHEELARALPLQHEAESEGVEEHPRESVRKVQPRAREPRRREDDGQKRVRHHKEQHKILGPAEKHSVLDDTPRLDGRTGICLNGIGRSCLGGSICYADRDGIAGRSCAVARVAAAGLPQATLSSWAWVPQFHSWCAVEAQSRSLPHSQTRSNLPWRTEWRVGQRTRGRGRVSALVIEEMKVAHPLS